MTARNRKPHNRERRVAAKVCRGFDAFTLWQPDAVKVTRGKENIGTFNKTPKSGRKWYKKCGGHVFCEYPGMGLTDVYAAMLPDLKFKPAGAACCCLSKADRAEAQLIGYSAGSSPS